MFRLLILITCVVFGGKPSSVRAGDWAELSSRYSACRSLSMKLAGEAASFKTEMNLLVNADSRFTVSALRRPNQLPDTSLRNDRFFDGGTFREVSFLADADKQFMRRNGRPDIADGSFAEAEVNDGLAMTDWILCPWPLLDRIARVAMTDRDRSVRIDGDRTILTSPLLGMTLVIDRDLRLTQLQMVPSTLFPSRPAVVLDFDDFVVTADEHQLSLPRRITQTSDLGEYGKAVSTWIVVSAEVNPPDAEERLIFNPVALKVIPHQEMFPLPATQLPMPDSVRRNLLERLGKPAVASTSTDPGSVSASSGAPNRSITPENQPTDPALPRDPLRNPANWGWALAGIGVIGITIVLVRRRIAA